MTSTMRREDVARAVADAVLAVPGVARLAVGSGVEVATHFPGGKVLGLRLAGDCAEVHIVADRVPVNAVADEAGAAARRVLDAAGDQRGVRIVVDDLLTSAIERRGRG